MNESKFIELTERILSDFAQSGGDYQKALDYARQLYRTHIGTMGANSTCVVERKAQEHSQTNPGIDPRDIITNENHFSKEEQIAED